MALIGNYSIYSKSPGRFRSGTSISGDRANFNNSSSARNMFTAGTAVAEVSNFSSVPNGSVPPYSWIIPQKGGGMASYTLLTAAISNVGNLAAGINISSSITGTVSTLDAEMDLLIDGVSSISLLGSLNTPILSGLVPIVAAITGSIAVTNAVLFNGTISITSAITGAISTTANLDLLLDFSANPTGNISVTNGNLTNGSFSITANLSALCSIATGFIRAYAGISADILPYTELSPENLANAVWETQLGLNSVGTKGDLLEKVLTEDVYLTAQFP